ncbi:MAG: glutamate racemase [bacterium]|nr:glutamate racemase [bacterium]
MNQIGVFDSGVGGLTVVRALKRRLPNESILFLGDTARLPYGIKSRKTIARYTQRNVEFLERRGVKAVVVACNTASALGLSEVSPNVPLWGVVEPGAARAARVSKRCVGVLGTESTVLSEAYQQAILEHRPELEVVSQACPLFVPLVEEGWLEDPVTRQVARRYLQPLIEHGVDTVVLGCTHYPLLKPVLRELFDDAVELVDSAEVVAAEIADALAQADDSEAQPRPRDRFLVTDAADRFERLAHRILAGDWGTLELTDL